MTDPLPPLTSAELADLKAKAKAATPGRWEFGHTGDEKRMVLGGTNRSYVASVQIWQTPRKFGLYDEPQRLANAAHIAAANPETILRLIDMIERQKKALKEIASRFNFGTERGIDHEAIARELYRRQKIASEALNAAESGR